MNPPITYVVPDEKTSPLFGRAFAQGCGGSIERGDVLCPGAVALFGSPKRWELLQTAFRQNRDVYYCDHAYFGRGRYYRITKNAYQHDGRGNAGPERFNAFDRKVQPWRRDGQHVLICPNSAIYFGLFGLNVYEWVQQVCDVVAANSTRPVRVRWKNDSTPIESDLKDCWAVVTFTSAAALDALIAGVPVFVLSAFSAAYRFGLSDLREVEHPLFPVGREPFLWNLAANQWTLDEIREGVAWKALQGEAVPA